MQFYCGKDKEYNDLATIFFNTQVLLEFLKSHFLHSFIYLLRWYVYGLHSNEFSWLAQDDAIRNLFSAKTIHEFSAQSLLTFLVGSFFSDFVSKNTSVCVFHFARLMRLSLESFTRIHLDKLYTSLF